MKIAIIGSGIAGLSAAWCLHEKHDITVFEKQGYVGGHCQTVENSDGTPLDIGFSFYNPWASPYFTQLLRHLGVPVKKSRATFSLYHGDGSTSGVKNNLNKISTQASNIFKLSHWKTWRQITKFYFQAPIWLSRHPRSKVSLKRFLDHYKYNQHFIDHHLTPIASSIFGLSLEQMLDLPAVTFLHFLNHYELFKTTRHPQWVSIQGGTKPSIDALIDPFKNKIKLGERVASVLRGKDSATVTAVKGDDTNIYAFDQVIIATDAAQALKLLQNPSDEETAILGAFKYHSYDVYLHSDTDLMPSKKDQWGGWNFKIMTSDGDTLSKTDTTYWANPLQDIDGDNDYFLSINPTVMPTAYTILRKSSFQYPLIDGHALDAQTKIPTIQGINRTWFCGSYTGFGFHEDGLCSGLAVANAFGEKEPWHGFTPVSLAGGHTINPSIKVEFPAPIEQETGTAVTDAD